MISQETPLDEIAAHLPHSAAKLLSVEDSNTQIAMLGLVKSCLIYWQDDKYEFDPIIKEGVLNALVISQLSLLKEVQRLGCENQTLRVVLAQADRMLSRRPEGSVDD